MKTKRLIAIIALMFLLCVSLAAVSACSLINGGATSSSGAGSSYSSGSGSSGGATEDCSSGHNFVGGVCSRCGKTEQQASEDYLRFELNADNESYTVYARYRNNMPAEIVIPVTFNGKPVTNIGEHAFYKCSGLTSVDIPDGIVSIGCNAFENSGLTSVTIPNSVASIGNGAFDGCSNLKYNKYNNGLYYLGNESNPCLVLMEVNQGIPFCVVNEETKIIYWGAFSGCSGLERIEVDNGNLFYHSDGNCVIETQTKTLIVGCKNSVIPFDGSVTSIGDYAFSGCRGLTSITIPDSVTSIDDYAFQGCSGLDGVIIPDSVISVGYCAFYGCRELNNIIIPNGVISIGWGAFSCCDNLEYNEYDNGLYLGNESNPYLVLIKAKNKDVATCVINENTKIIYLAAFSECAITGIVIPNSVTSIGIGAFAYCRGLTSVVIPDGVTFIGNSAFSNCRELEKIEVDKNNLVYHSEGNCIIETDTKILIAGCKNSVVPFDGSVTSIDDHAFQGCSELNNIIIPDSVISIGDCAFVRCDGLTSIIIGKGVVSIGDTVFKGYSGLERIEVDNDNLFYHSDGNCLIETETKTLIVGCKNSIIPSDGSVTSIYDDAFQGCRGLTSVIIPDSVTSIGDSAFENCSGLTSVVIPDSVTSIGMSAFYGCSGLTSVVIPDSVTSIDGLAFGYCSGLTSVVIPDSVTSIWDSAFYGCDELKKVYYKGNEVKWSKISIGSNNEKLKTATIYYYSETKPREEGNYWHYDSNGNVAEW